MKEYVVAMETLRIDDFLFSTNKMKVKRGGSYLLDYLNKIEVPEILFKNEVNEKDIIDIGAGKVKFFIEEEEEAKKIIKEIENRYAIMGAKIVGKYLKKENKKIWDIIEELNRQLLKEEDRGFSVLNIDLPFIEKCELNKIEPADIHYLNLEEDLKKIIDENSKTEENNFNFKIKNGKLIYKTKKIEKELEINIETLRREIKILTEATEENEKGKISEVTLWKIVYANFLKKDIEFIEKDKKNRKEKVVSFYQYLKKYEKIYNNISKTKINIDVETNIDDFDNKNDFIGLMYSDGDSFGEFFNGIKNKFNNLKIDDSEEKYIEFLKEFSHLLDKVIKSSLARTLIKIFKNVEENKRWGQFLIAAGDDVCAIFDSTLVLEISMNFQKEFQKRMKRGIHRLTKDLGKIDDINLTSSSGVVIAKKKTPMFQLFKQAINLQKSAKEKRYEQDSKDKNTGFIDFQVIGSEGRADIISFRESVSNLIERPYAIEIKENNNGIRNIGDLLDVVKEMKRIDFPTTKLRYIYELKKNLELENFEKKWDFVNVLSKMDKKHIEFIKEIMMDKDYEKFNESFDNIFDIIEIYNFVDEKIMDNKKDGVTNGN